MKQRKQLKQYKKALKKILNRYGFNLNAFYVSDRECMKDLLILANWIKKKQIKRIKKFLDNYSFYSVSEDLICYYTSGDYILNNYSLYSDELRKKNPLDLNAFVNKYIK